MKNLKHITIVLLILVSLVSCQKNSRPNYEFMPNMYKSVGYEAYQESDAFANGVESQLPALGTIPRGYTPFDIDNTNEGYELAKTTLVSKLDSLSIDTARGKELYNIYCGICHGNKGKGLGKLVKREKILGVPSYADRDLTIGSTYHTIYYGKNAMGSYANLINEEERWQVVAYVEKLKAELEK